MDRILINLMLAIVSCSVLIIASTIIQNNVQRSMLKRKGELYIAMRLFLEDESNSSREELISMEIEEMDREVESILNDDYVSKNLSENILKSNMPYIHKYYIIAVKNNLYKKERKKKF